MSNTSFGKINLASLSSHKIMGFGQKDSKESIDCIVIPIEKNNLFLSKKGNVYLDLVIFERKEPLKNDEGGIEQTHFVKQSLPKDVRAAMSDDERKEQPILGNLNMFSGYTEKQAEPDNNIETPPEPADGEDLPF